MLEDFYLGTTLTIAGEIYLNDQKPDISPDAVRFLVKKAKSDADQDAVIDKQADVSTSGANGYYYVNCSPVETAVNPGSYYYEIIWNRLNGEEYVLEQGRVTILERVEEVS